MELLSDIVGGLFSAGTGGIFGLLSAGIGAWAKAKERAEEHKREIDRWAHEEKLQELNMQARKEETEQELAIVSQQGSYDNLSASIRADASTSKSCSQWVTDAKALTRPVLTGLLWIMAAWVFAEMLNAMTKPTHPLATAFGVEGIKDLIRYMVYSVFFCASTATTWWFGDRALTPPNFKHR